MVFSVVWRRIGELVRCTPTFSSLEPRPPMPILGKLPSRNLASTLGTKNVPVLTTARAAMSSRGVRDLDDC